MITGQCHFKSLCPSYLPADPGIEGCCFGDRSRTACPSPFVVSPILSASLIVRWPWPPNVLRKFEVTVVVRAIEGVAMDQMGTEISGGAGVMSAEVRWKGPRMKALSSLRRKVRRNCTREEEVKGEKGGVEWNEEFVSVVGLTGQKENVFYPWEIGFAVFYGVKQVFKNKSSIVGMTSLNLAEYASLSGEEFELNLPLSIPNANPDSPPILHLTLKLLECRSCPESPEIVQRHVVPAPLSPPPGDASYEKDESLAQEAGLRKGKIFTEPISARKSKKTFREDEGSDGRYSAGSEDADYNYQFDSDSMDDNPDEELEDRKGDSIIRKSFSYGSLSNSNFVDGVISCETNFNGEYEDCVYHNRRRSDVDYSPVEETAPSVTEQQFISQSTKRSILPWRTRKYKSPKAKGEPLLKKAYREEGGDDIDYDRRQLTSSDESFSGMGHKADDDQSVHHSFASDFGDDNFAVGSWESKTLISRDGKLKLSTKVFFASIDQRSERVSGQSACTALVAIIADWFNSNRDVMPNKSQFDALIREGSLEWRKLCENQTYREQFPDKHFDLETIIQAKVRPLSVVPNKSFVGFFHPEGFKDNRGLEFLHGAMSFDDIWDEINSSGSSDCLYIVSWNDHFFVLKVEHDEYFIIDTLGERLHEGCDQAYILKFDQSTEIKRISNQKTADADADADAEAEESKEEAIDEEDLICRGKESCKEYIKSFLAAIPIRELEADIKKGFMASAPLHRRLQIEFHYTEARNDIINLAKISPLPFFESASQISAMPSSALLAV
ncbi:uncharacterized protein LOC110034775 [Phalaenopsis equestris]|uniref:uncharacterized protein LOC110034775 n=1 Tax=Phalaenopsis equestris TaxID=78828 RepID=UPI0009E2811E|nr:uncharacterized protein LOC110034775 [Phalaenopsis equestris]